MTELERARAHLQEVREQLRWARIDAFRNEGFFTKPAVVELHAYERRVENAVLAALSWLWEEQEKERKRGIAHLAVIDGSYKFYWRGHAVS